MAGEATLEVDLQVTGARKGAPPRLQARFSVPPGVTVLFGPSGAGKSTCLSAIAGLLRPGSGRICLGSEVLTDTATRTFVPPHRRRVALVFQSLALFPHMTVLQNVAYGAAAKDRQARRDEAQAWLARARVGHLADRQPSTLSGGEAQRVALARALASLPRVLLLDEPFSALDLSLRRELGEELGALIKELSLPTVLVTHDRADALLLGERMVALSEGLVVAEGAPAEVLER